MSMQGYEANNPNIEFLRLKNFTIGRKLKDEEVLGPGSLDIIAGLVGTMAPFVSLILFLPLFNLSSSRVAAMIRHLFPVGATFQSGRVDMPQTHRPDLSI
jgi:Conserved hypothetical protein (DUF2461)